MPASQDFRDGAATGASEMAERLMKLDIWGIRLTGEIARTLAKGISYEYGGGVEPTNVSASDPLRAGGDEYDVKTVRQIMDDIRGPRPTEQDS